METNMIMNYEEITPETAKQAEEKEQKGRKKNVQ